MSGLSKLANQPGQADATHCTVTQLQNAASMLACDERLEAHCLDAILNLELPATEFSDRHLLDDLSPGK